MKDKDSLERALRVAVKLVEGFFDRLLYTIQLTELSLGTSESHRTHKDLIYFLFFEKSEDANSLFTLTVRNQLGGYDEKLFMSHSGIRNFLTLRFISILNDLSAETVQSSFEPTFKQLFEANLSLQL